MQPKPAVLAIHCAIALLSSSMSRATEIPSVGKFSEATQIATGFGFVEGPAWDGAGTLYFSDIPNAKIHTLDLTGKIGVFTAESGNSNGLMVSPTGGLLACEAQEGSLVEWDVATKTRTVRAAKYNGVRFNAPNDLVLDSASGVYFTDPHYNGPEPWPQKVRGVYYVPAKGEPVRVVEDLPAPNGILLSIDERTLYVLPSGSSEMRAYEVLAPGKLGQERMFCKLLPKSGETEAGGADGATLDERGNLYITSGAGLQVVSPEGDVLGIIPVPEHPANVTFGGAELKTLYVTARTSLYSIEAPVKGHRFGVKPE